jgi:DedD protein
VVGSVFADWDADGVPDPDEGPLEGIPVVLGKTASTTSSARGDFSFTNVPTGQQRVQVDLGALPVDFDPPVVPAIEIDLSRGETRRVAFGLVPLGSVSGRVLRDANGNGAIDPADEPLDAAVLVLDGGQRSEQARKGQYRFEAVRSGPHKLELLLESLPDGAAIIGERQVDVAVTRERQATTSDFLVKIDKRPEIRKVFPPKGGGGAAATTTRPSNSPRPSVGKPTPVPASAQHAEQFTIQVAALSALEDAQALVAELKRAGYAAYVVLPPPDDPNGLHRVRVGRYASRALAARTATRLERLRGEKLWVTKER